MKWRPAVALMLIANVISWCLYVRWMARSFDDPFGNEQLGFLLGVYAIVVPFCTPFLGFLLIWRQKASSFYWPLLFPGFIASIGPLVFVLIGAICKLMLR